MADVGDQYSDLLGGDAGHQVKIPNPMYYIPDQHRSRAARRARQHLCAIGRPRDSHTADIRTRWLAGAAALIPDAHRTR